MKPFLTNKTYINFSFYKLHNTQNTSLCTASDNNHIIYLNKISGAPFEIIYNGDYSNYSSRLTNPSFLEFKQAISNQSREKSLSEFDSTNACVFLSIDLCQKVYLSEENQRSSDIVRITQDIILKRTKYYNTIRDISQVYEVEDALNCMGNPIVNNGRIEFYNLASKQLIDKISGFLYEASTICKDIGFIYMCDIYSFSFGFNNGILYLVETHKVTPYNGMVCSISSKSANLKSVCNELALLIEKRLLLSLKDKVYTESHAIYLLTKSPLTTEEVGKLNLFKLEHLLNDGDNEEHLCPTVPDDISCVTDICFEDTGQFLSSTHKSYDNLILESDCHDESVKLSGEEICGSRGSDGRLGPIVI